MLKTRQNYRGAVKVVIPVSAVPLRIFVFLTTSRLPSGRRPGFPRKVSTT
jgi:hypothetical protein